MIKFICSKTQSFSCDGQHGEKMDVNVDAATAGGKKCPAERNLSAWMQVQWDVHQVFRDEPEIIS